MNPPTEISNETFANEFVRRLNLLVLDCPKDMLSLGTQPLPTGTEGGSMVLWRIFSLLCLEGNPGFLIVPHQSETAIVAIHAIPASEHDEYRMKRKTLPEPDRLPPQWSNSLFANELVRRINLLYREYPEWVMRWLAHDLLVRHELARQIKVPGISDTDTVPIGLAVLLSLACSGDHNTAPFGIAPAAPLTDTEIIQAVEATAVVFATAGDAVH